MLNTKLLTVSEITREIKLTLEKEFSQISVIGEISNFKAHNSGHWYFNLKDTDAVINCTMWRGFNNYVFFTPQDGMKVIVNGKITVYPPRGNYQLDVRSMKPAGVGELQAAFEALKEKLSEEGLFDPSHKKPIPVFPQKIGIVTAPDGAAFRDMISVAERRYPLVELVISPARVQGSGAAESIVEGIRQLNYRDDIDVMIVSRGGGSIEDLWSFNEEIVARAIYNSKIPVISGVGHETDFTIADFTADLRAPTPSAAMELATPDKADIFAFIDDFSYNSTLKINEYCRKGRHRLSSVLGSYGFRVPLDIVRNKSQLVDNLLYKVLQTTDHRILLLRNKVSLLTKIIESNNIQKTLNRGFALVRQDDKYIKRKAKFTKNEDTELVFADGSIKIEIEKNGKEKKQQF
jgi:exodeoxyribonuclease VII large subunit